MFKCKECGAEYEEKPDYCDCGNDEFEEVVIEDSTKPQPSSIKSESGDEPVQEKSNDADNVGQVSPDKHFEQNKPIPTSSMKFSNAKTISKKQTFSEQYPDFTRFKKSLDPVSLIIFCVCIISSFYVVLFAWNPNEQDGINDGVNTGVKESKEEFKSTASIPSIDKFWNNTLPVVKQDQPKSKPEETNVVKQIINIPSPKKVVSQPVKPFTKQKVTVVPLKKITTQKVASKLATTAVKTQTNTNAQLQAKKQAEDIAKQKAEAERKKAEAEQLKKLQAEQAKKQAEARAIQTQLAKQEFVSYKANLRNTIGRKIDFTRVIGDGSCTVAFKIDSNGKLVNRSFSKQSSNNTLNDAVYSAVMSTPTFNPPPSAYNNETLYLSIKFHNGNFEISLP